MKKIIVLLSVVLTVPCTACNNDSHNDNHIINIEDMRLKISIGETELLATCMDNSAARDFIALLPLTVTLEDYNSTEKIFSLSDRVSTTDMPSGYEPAAGDIAYYAPWGNMCIFYRSFRYSQGLIPIGKIEGDISALQVSGSIEEVRFELIEKQ